MALTQEQEEERIRRLSALEASTPQYLQMQGEGLSAFGDILGIDTPNVDAKDKSISPDVITKTKGTTINTITGSIIKTD